MPVDPSLAAAAVSSASNLLGAGVQGLFTGIQNRASRKWSEKMYQRTLEDNIRFWQMQNEYNSPAEQMKRYMDAGLNKNLVFSAGNPGNAGSISTPDVQQPHFRTPEIGDYISRAGGALGTYLDYQIKLAQLDNLKTDNTVKQEDAILRRAQTKSTLTEAERRAFDLEFERGLQGVSADFRREQLRQIRANTNVTLRRDEREALQNSSNLKEAAQRILTMRQNRAQSRAEVDRIRATIRDLDRNVQLKDLEIEMRKNKVSFSDPLLQRIFGYIIGDASSGTYFGNDPSNKNHWLHQMARFLKGN